MSGLTELLNRGIADVLIVCCDGLKGLPDAIRATWPAAEVQLCVVHLARSSLRYASKKYWGPICRDMKEIYTATLEAAEKRFSEFAAEWESLLPGHLRYLDPTARPLPSRRRGAYASRPLSAS
jgi:transposase-like protein